MYIENLDENGVAQEIVNSATSNKESNAVPELDIEKPDENSTTQEIVHSASSDVSNLLICTDQEI